MSPRQMFVTFDSRCIADRTVNI